MADAQGPVALPALLTIEQAAALVPCAVGSLKQPSFRERLGVPFYRIGGRIFFDPEDIARWRESRRVEPVPA